MLKNNTIIRFDWAIRTILRESKNFDILEGFLFSILGQYVTVESVLEHESYSDSPSALMKCGRIDLVVKDYKDTPFLVKIQNRVNNCVLERLCYTKGRGKVHAGELPEDFDQIRKTVYIKIVNTVEGRGKDYLYHGKTEFTGLNTGEAYDPCSSLVEFEEQDSLPELYILNLGKFNGIVLDDRDEWIYYLKFNDIQEDFSARHIGKVKERLKVSSLSDAEKESYEEYVGNLSSEKHPIKELSDITGLAMEDVENIYKKACSNKQTFSLDL